MFTLQQKQIANFTKIEEAKFVQKTVVFIKYNYRDWTKNRSDEELEDFVNEMILIGKKSEIFKEVNIQKLIFLNIQFQYPLPLTFAHRILLKEENIDEDHRVKKFYKALLNISS